MARREGTLNLKTSPFPLPSIYYIIHSMFCIALVIGNIISTKMVKLPLFQDFSIPAGILTYPLTFFLSGLVTEIYGSNLAKKMVYHAFGMSIFSYFLIKVALLLPSPNLEKSLHFQEVLGLNGIILLASLTGYIFSQTIDIYLYARIKSCTGPKYLWLRNNGSTITAQLIDTMIVNIIHLKLGVGMTMAQLFPIMLFSYLYKCSFSLVFTPLFYFLVFLFKRRVLVYLPWKKLMRRKT